MEDDFCSVLTEALDKMGCSKEKISTLDEHSPIEMTFSSIPPIIISFVREDPNKFIRISCEFEACPTHTCDLKASDWSRIASADVWWAMGGALSSTLYRENNSPVLTAILSRDAITDAVRLGHALEDFYDRAVQLSDLFRNS